MIRLVLLLPRRRRHEPNWVTLTDERDDLIRSEVFAGSPGHCIDPIVKRAELTDTPHHQFAPLRFLGRLNHLACVIRPSGDITSNFPQHRLWKLRMTITATAAIFIRDLNPGRFSLFHIFVPMTYWSVFGALWSLRRGDVAGHKRAMLGLYFGGILIAGALTFAPGRMMHRLFLE